MNTDTKNLPKDVFLNLLGVITLYISAISLITLLFQYINLSFPDTQYASYQGYAGIIRWAMASLFIIFPTHLWVMKMLYADFKKNPEKKELRFRKWIVYFTLFLTAIVVIVDLVSLVYFFLGGDMTMRFVLKVATVFLVAGSIFWFDFWELKNRWKTNTLGMFMWGTVVIVLGSVIGGFFTVGSPLKARLYNFDSQKTSDLQSIQWQIVNYWQTKKVLPSSLTVLKDDISGFSVPLDPQTGVIYEYKTTGALSFDLCANFNLPSSSINNDGNMVRPVMPGTYEYDKLGSDSWDHGSGRQCFNRTIDPEKYKLPQ